MGRVQRPRSSRRIERDEHRRRRARQERERLTLDPYDKELWSRATGKIYRTGFGAGTCSGSVIRSKHRNLVLTAAHCVYDQAKKQWKGDDDFVFVPARGMDPKARDKPVNWEKCGAWKRK
ncbi:trypsin-like serine peptidase [Streptomyces acidicola]|uniref:trypsin-like serine peptidase n=1 Tax=Streptomyces acidicola TaxID=2596892 RepID=UPI003800BA8E